MRNLCKNIVIISALAAGLAVGVAQAQTIGVPAGPDPFTITFDENGNGTVGGVAVSSFSAVDPNTGKMALTYALPETIVTGIGDILDPTGALSDALSWYDQNGHGYMAFYSLSGGDLADTISGGFVPTGAVIAHELANGTFTYTAGTPPTANVYNGTSLDNAKAPDGGSTLALLGGAFALVGALNRKLRA